MAQQGLFTQGTSVQDLMADRRQRGTDLQNMLMQQAAQGARNPVRAQGASMLGSILGRSLAGAMGGQDTEMEKLKAKNAQLASDSQSYGTAALGGSIGMREEALRLQATNPRAALAMTALYKAELAKEQDVITKKQDDIQALAKIKKDEETAEKKALDIQAEVIRKESIAKGIRIENRAEQLRREGVAQETATATATAEEALNKVTIYSGEEYNRIHGTDLSPTSMWKTTPKGTLTQIDKQSKANVTYNVPEGMTATYDDTTGAITELTPIKGGKQWLEAQAAMAEANEDALRTLSNDETTTTSSQVVNRAIDKALALANTDAWDTMIFGMDGQAMSNFDGNARADMEALMMPIEAEAAFSTLKDMREASKTGGALGAINTAELILLKNARGALALSQSKGQFIGNLEAYKVTYNDFIHGTEAEIAGYNKLNPNKKPLVYWGSEVAEVTDEDVSPSVGGTEVQLDASALSYLLPESP